MLTETLPRPFAPGVLAILGLETAVDLKHVEWELVTPESRHRLWRLRLPASTPGPKSYVVKYYHHATDRHFDHRFRREERALNLLGRLAPGLVPTIHGGCITEGHSAFLVLEDLGDVTLHVELEASPPEARRRLMIRAIDSLAVLHRQTDRHAPSFRALCYSANLDRITSRTMMARFAIALERCAAPNGRLPLSAAERNAEFHRAVVAPLLKSRRRVIHGSYSPLNLCVSETGHATIVDFETLSTGPAEMDLSELLSYPLVDLGRDEASFVNRYARSAGRVDPNSGFQTRVHLAAVARCIDYAGTLTLRRAKFEREGHHELAMVQLHRRNLYVQEAVRRAAEAGLSSKLTRLLHSLVPPPGGLA